MKLLFVVSTPFQLFNAAQIRSTLFSEDTANIIVLGTGREAYNVFLSASGSDCFDSSEFVKVGYTDTDSRLRYSANRILTLAKGKLKSHLVKQKYDFVFTTGMDLFSKVIVRQAKNTFKGLSINLFEDGYGSYTTLLTKEFNEKQDKLFMLRFGYSIKDRSDALYVYQPSFVESDYPSIQIKKIPSVDDSAGIPPRILALKGNTKQELFDKYTVLFLESNFYDEHILKTQRKCEEFLFSRLGSSLSVKSHPNETRCDEPTAWNCVSSEIPFEVSLAHRNINDKCLVALASSACLTPKLVFDKEPWVVFLYRLAPFDCGARSRFDRMIEKMRLSYRSPEKIIVPSSFAEFEVHIDRMKRSHASF